MRAVDANLTEVAARLGDLAAGTFYLVEADEPTDEQREQIEAALGFEGSVTDEGHAAQAGQPYETSRNLHSLVLKTLWYTDQTSSVAKGEITLLVSEGVLATLRRGSYDPMSAVRERLRQRVKLLTYGVWGVVYATVDETVGQYLAVAADLAVDVTQVEGKVFSGHRVNMVEQIYQLRREAMESRDAVAPLLPMAAEPLQESAWTHNLPPSYARSVAHRITAAGRAVHANEEQLGSILSAHLAQIGMWQNEDMRKIAAWAAIIAVPTLIAGVYGMNFRHMPELHWLLGYPLSLLAMATLCAVLFRNFRAKGWF